MSLIYLFIFLKFPVLQRNAKIQNAFKSLKTEEVLFSTRHDKPDSPVLQIDDINIELHVCDNVKYLGVFVDNKLRFEEYVQNTVTKASQRMHIVRTFLYKSTK